MSRRDTVRRELERALALWERRLTTFAAVEYLAVELERLDAVRFQAD